LLGIAEIINEIHHDYPAANVEGINLNKSSDFYYFDPPSNTHHWLRMVVLFP